MSNFKNNFLHFSLLFIQPIFMTSNIAIGKGALGFIPPISLAFWRWFIVFLFMFPFVYREIRQKRHYIKDELPDLAILGVTGFSICGAFPYVSGFTTTVTNMSIIYALAPIMIVLLSSVYFKERLKLVQHFGIWISFTGVAFVIFKADIENLLSLVFTYGDLWMLISATSWAVFSISLIHRKSHFSIFSRFALMSFMGAAFLFPFFIIENIYFISTDYDLGFVFFVLLAAIFPVFIAFTMYTKLQQLIGASLAGLTVYLMPIYGSIYGMILFGEKLEIYHFYGALLVLVGIFLANKKYSK